MASCSVASDQLSCDFPPKDGLDACGDWSDVAFQYRTTIETFCRAGGSEFLKGTCPTTNRVGGCKATSSDGVGITWYYPSEKVATQSDVAKQCKTGDVLLDPSGKEVEQGNGVCSKERTEIAVLTFKNSTASTVSLYWRDENCAEQFQDVLMPTEIKGQSTHPEDVWVVRAGDHDPAGTILLEHVCAESRLIEIK